MVAVEETINEQACLVFLKKYPLVFESMLMFIQKNSDLLSSYNKWIEWKPKNEARFGGEVEEINSVTYGKAIFFKYELGNLSGWYELFRYAKEYI